MSDNRKTIKNIIFDIGKVLVGFEWKEYVLSLFDEETARAVTKAMWDEDRWYELDRGVLPEEEILESFYRADPEHKAEIRETYDRAGECVQRRDYVIPWIESLKEAGFRVYFLSNYSEHLMQANPEALDFVPHMDGGVFSCHVKAIKPDPAIYHALLEKYGLDPQECVFLDDQERNITAARQLGIRAAETDA